MTAPCSEATIAPCRCGLGEMVVVVVVLVTVVVDAVRPDDEIVAALLENNQTPEDNRIPQALQPYCHPP